MIIELEFTDIAEAHLVRFRKFEQQLILDQIEGQLTREPTQETKNRKKLRPNALSDWELRIDKYRVFYDVLIERGKYTVKIKGIGYKEHNRLYLGGREFKL